MMSSGTCAALFHSCIRTLAYSCDPALRITRALTLRTTRALASRVGPRVLRGGSGSRLESVIESATRRGRTG